MKTVRLNHLRAALLAAAAAGLLAAVGLVVVLYAQPAEANYPGTTGKIAYAGYDGQRLRDLHHQPRRGKQRQSHQQPVGQLGACLLTYR